MRSCNYCSRGSRIFAKQYGLDWDKFVFEGIPVEEMEALNDALADAAIEAAKLRNEQENK